VTQAFQPVLIKDKYEGYHLDILYKEHLAKLRVINAAPRFNSHLHRLESLCHQS
jgi:hypothetical protein